MQVDGGKYKKEEKTKEDGQSFGPKKDGVTVCCFDFPPQRQ